MNPEGHHAMNGYRPDNVASTSSDVYNDFGAMRTNQHHFSPNLQQQQLQMPQSMQHHGSQHQWQDLMMQMNNPQFSGNAASLQNQQQFNTGSWANQMPPPQAFPGAMAMSLNVLPTQILQEAMAMSNPVEASDEPTLLTKLLSSARRQESYKDALNSLHGKNGHSASLWKDYYLDHRVRLDAWISMCLQKEKEKEKEGSSSLNANKHSTPSEQKRPLPTARKPSPSSFRREASQTSFSRVSVPVPSKRPKKRSSQHSTPPIVTDQPQPGRRNTINSLTAPSPVFGGRLPAPNAEIKIPEPPSRSPSPPTNVVPLRGRGHKYTKEDREFFIKFVGWSLKKDPSLTRLEICERLAEKASHHSAQSWASHWSNNHDVPDKILAAARGEEYKSSYSSSNEEHDMKVTAKRRPKYKDISTSEEESNEGSDVADQHDESEDNSDGEDLTPLLQYSDKEMGQRGEPFNDADLYVTAKYIAAFTDWEAASSKERWDPYHEKYPQRSAKSWGEYYRRNERALMKLVKRLRSERAKATASSFQCARPTRAPPKTKRKYDYDSSEESFVKRGKAD
ncbi:hypothetical protein JR316_0000666 [Psilocybe cubensis]|uniref:Uncharacterized protein n=2 Tax=Psilocybe cubensis TaxID=181762 RepID=A0A8H7Y5K8_PSICU|nr:hypothetical protein JR316_0000666 [Psilocybe cubensis]KAH9486601.1 hypothetical protein JR316_0000666 [Psilocybe cubensis]